jgi:hypothetical protein
MTKEDIENLRLILNDKKLQAVMNDSNDSIVRQFAYNEALSAAIVLVKDYAEGNIPKGYLTVLKERKD